MNRYIEERVPWKQAKAGEMDELGVTLYTCLEAIRIVASLAAPIMPAASNSLLKQIGISGGTDGLQWDSVHQWGLLSGGSRVEEPKPLFPRINDVPTQMAAITTNTIMEAETLTEETVVVTQEVTVPAAEVPAAEAIPTITIDDFMKVELRVGKVVAAEPIPNATKLLKLTVEIGGVERTVLAGIAEMYTAEELVGKLVVVVANLAPRKMRGIESQGMLLAADIDGQAILLQPETVVPTGSRVR